MLKSLSSEQIEILKLFDRDLPSEDWIRLRDVIAAFFSAGSVEEANKVWDEKKWTDKDAEKMLHSHLRTPS